jgi:hypothetical protein
MTDAISKFIAAVEEHRLTAVELNNLPVSQDLRNKIMKVYLTEQNLPENKAE